MTADDASGVSRNKMSLPPDIAAVFENVVARAERLKRSTYIQQLIKQGSITLNVSFNVPEREGSMSLDVPGEEPRDALLLTARMFVQNNDQVSFGWLNANAAPRPEPSYEWKEAFRFIRAEFNAYLGASTGLNFFGKQLTNWDIFETCVYGHYAHSNVRLGKDFARWTAEPLGKGFVDFNFASIVMRLVNYVAMLAELCEMELRGEEIPTPPTAITAAEPTEEPTEPTE